MATSPELKEALKSAADKIAKYVENVATMTVETRCVVVGSGSDESKMVARTIVKLDGDSETILPMKPGPDGALMVDTLVNEMHQENVQTAIDYRTEMMERLLTLLKGE